MPLHEREVARNEDRDGRHDDTAEATTHGGASSNAAAAASAAAAREHGGSQAGDELFAGLGGDHQGHEHGPHAHDHRLGGEELDRTPLGEMPDRDGGEQDRSARMSMGDEGRHVRNVQEWLVRLEYLPDSHVTGVFDFATAIAIMRMQIENGMVPTLMGAIDDETAFVLRREASLFRQMDRNRAQDDAADRELHDVSLFEGIDVWSALVPQRGGGSGGAATFEDSVEGRTYGDRMREHLSQLIDDFHRENFAEREPLRADPAENFFDWGTIESAASAAKDVTNEVYGNYIESADVEISTAQGTLVDAWEDEEAENAGLSADDRRFKALDLLEYFAEANSADVNEMHSAIPSRAEEAAILRPIYESFLDTPEEIQKILEIQVGWDGMQSGGTIYMQRFKHDSDEDNRAQLWETFHTCIHEYLHLVAHDDFRDYANEIYDSGDPTRYNTLIEGFCDYFTQIVRAGLVVPEPMRRRIEGPYYDASAPPPEVSPGVYPSARQAQSVADIVGHDNCATAYFGGDVSRLVGDWLSRMTP